MRGTTARDRASNPSATARAATLTGAPVDTMFVLKAAALAIHIDVLRVTQRRSTDLDRIVQDVADRVMQPPRRCRINRVGRAVGAQARPVEDLVCVDVADASDLGLVEQERFERLARGSDELTKVSCVGSLPRLGSTPRRAMGGNSTSCIGGVVRPRPRRTCVDRRTTFPCRCRATARHGYAPAAQRPGQHSEPGRSSADGSS